MDIRECFESKYLKASDLPPDRDVVVMIASVTIEDVGTVEQPERKPVVRFNGKDRGLCCNRTNADMIAELLGTFDTDQWIGKRVALFVTKAPFRGQMVPAIRIRATAPAPPGAAASAPAHYGQPDPNLEHALAAPAAAPVPVVSNGDTTPF